jgi:hypothetical protein
MLGDLVEEEEWLSPLWSALGEEGIEGGVDLDRGMGSTVVSSVDSVEASVL